VEAIPLSALPKDTSNKLAGLSSNYPFLIYASYAERQAGNWGSSENFLSRPIHFGLTQPKN